MRYRWNRRWLEIAKPVLLRLSKSSRLLLQLRLKAGWLLLNLLETSLLWLHLLEASLLWLELVETIDVRLLLTSKTGSLWL